MPSTHCETFRSSDQTPHTNLVYKTLKYTLVKHHIKQCTARHILRHHLTQVSCYELQLILFTILRYTFQIPYINHLHAALKYTLVKHHIKQCTARHILRHHLTQVSCDELYLILFTILRSTFQIPYINHLHKTLE